MCSLTAALDFADFALRHAVQFGNLAWLSRCDLLTRGAMAGKVRRGMIAERALREAIQERHLDWRTASSSRLQEASTPAKRPLTQADSPSSKCSPQTVSMLPGNRGICKPRNDERGCQNPQCKDARVCDVRMPNGKACGSSTHTRANHS